MEIILSKSELEIILFQNMIYCKIVFEIILIKKKE